MSESMHVTRFDVNTLAPQTTGDGVYKMHPDRLTDTVAQRPLVGIKVVRSSTLEAGYEAPVVDREQGVQDLAGFVATRRIKL